MCNTLSYLDDKNYGRIEFHTIKPKVFYCDNKSIISMMKNPMFHGRTKHREIRYHFIRDQVISGTVEVKFCLTKIKLLMDLRKL